jgi:hypothetical protein
MVDVLDRERAPLAICRFVSWGKWAQDRAARLALALFLRRPSNGHGFAAGRPWTWPMEKQATAAERLLHDSPQWARLVGAGLFVHHGQVPTHDHMIKLTMAWDTSWPVIQREIATLDQAALLREAASVVATRSRMRVPGRRKPLTAEQAVLLEALAALRAAVLRGDVTAEELPMMMTLGSVKAPAQLARPEKDCAPTIRPATRRVAGRAVSSVSSAARASSLVPSQGRPAPSR